MSDQTQRSGVQKVLTGMFSPATAARMEADSRMWMMQCPNCGWERSIWELGGIRYKAVGNPRSLQRCPDCRQISWHKIYRREGPAPEVPISRHEGRPPRSLMWAIFLVMAAIFFCMLAIFAAGLLGVTYYVSTGTG